MISQEASQRGKHELFQLSPDHRRPNEVVRFRVWLAPALDWETQR